MIGKEVHLSDSEESSEDQPDEVVEKPPTLLAAPSHSMIGKEVHLSDSEESSEDQPDEVVEKPPTVLAAPSHSVPQLPGEGSQQEIGEVKRNPSAQNELCNMPSRNTSAKPLELLKRIIEAARKRKKSEKEKKSSVGAAPSISQEQKMLEEDLQLRDSEGGHDDQQVVEKPPCSLAGPWHSGPQLLEEGNQQEMGEVKLHPCAQNSPWKVTRKITCGKPLQLLKRIMEAERMAEKVEKEKMSLVGAAPSSSQKQMCSEKEEISVGCAATNLSSERNMIGKEVHLSDSEESSEDQPDEVVEKPPTLLAAPSHRMLEEDLQLRDSEGGHDDQVVEKPPCSLAGPWHSGPQLLEEGNQQEMGEVKLHPCAQNSPWKVTRKITCGKPLQLLKRIMEAERMAEKVEKEKMSLVGAAPSSSQKQMCSEKEEISVGCAATNLSSERNMIGKEVHLSDSEEGSEDQPDEVVEKPPTLLAAPSHRMLEEDLQLRDSEGGHDDQQVVEKPPCSLAGPWHSGPQLLEEGNQQEMGEVKLHPCAQNSPWKVTRKITCGKPLQLLKRIMEAERMAEKVEKEKMSLVGAAPSTSQKQMCSEKEEISVVCAATNLSSERNMIGKEVHLSDSEEGSEDQPDEVVEKPPTLLAAPSHRMLEEDLQLRDSEDGHDDQQVVEKPPCSLAGPWHSGPQLLEEGNQQEMGEVKLHPCAQNSPWKVTRKITCGKPLQLLKRIMEAERMAEKVEKEKMSLVGAAPSTSQKQMCSEKEEISVGCAATNLSSERNMIGKEVHLSDSEESSEDQPDEVVEKPPTLLAAPSHRMLEEDLQLRDSEGGHDDQQVVEKPPCSLAGPWHSGPQLLEEGNQQEMGEVKLHPCAQNSPWKVTRKITCGKPLQLLKRIMEAERMEEKLEKVKISLVGAAPSTSQKRECSEKEEISVVCAATNLSSERNGCQVPAKRNQKEMGEAKQHPSAQRQPLKVTPKNPSGKPFEKRKREKEGEAARKKLKSEKEEISVGCAATNLSSERNGPQVPVKSNQKEMGEAKQHPSAQRQPLKVTPKHPSGKPLEKRKREKEGEAARKKLKSEKEEISVGCAATNLSSERK
ncbi:muscle M-line assembly protein unc-89-like [Melanerpes formicivorus]|uniref:muscle M-line assembly protein unc-89-like n=1 Tax=Melanerpes formicivorus TaxID=211600 RepID=UPI00358F1BB8